MLDEIEKNKRTEMSRRISSKHRLENLQAICIDGKSPLTSKKVAENRDSVQWRSGMIDNERVSVDSCLQKFLSFMTD